MLEIGSLNLCKKKFGKIFSNFEYKPVHKPMVNFPFNPFFTGIFSLTSIRFYDMTIREYNEQIIYWARGYCHSKVKPPSNDFLNWFWHWNFLFSIANKSSWWQTNMSYCISRVTYDCTDRKWFFQIFSFLSSPISYTWLNIYCGL